MALTVTSPATGEPITLGDVKDHIRVSSSAEDVLLMGYIKSARQWAENYTRRAFMDTTFQLSLDRFPVGDEIELPRSPLSSTAVTVTYFPSSGGSLTFGSSKFVVDDQREPPRVVLNSSNAWPTNALRNANGVQVSFTAGYGASTDVPEAVLHALRLMVGQYHQNREGVVTGSMSRPAAFAVKSLLAGYRVPSVP